MGANALKWITSRFGQYITVCLVSALRCRSDTLEYLEIVQLSVYRNMDLFWLYVSVLIPLSRMPQSYPDSNSFRLSEGQ